MVGWWPRHWGAWSLLFFPFWWAYRLLLLPVLYLSRFLVWVTPGRRWRDKVHDHVLLGGAVLPWDVSALKREGVGFVISLCAELRDPVDRLKSEGIGHLHLPTLDRHAPSREATEVGVKMLGENVSRGVLTFVHCASGAGRSATLVACWLVSNGRSPGEAVRYLKERRKAVSLDRAQRTALESWAP